MSTGDGNKVYFSGEDDRHGYRFGFFVHKDIASAVIGCRPVSTSLISIRLRAAPFNITIIQVYAPTSGHNDSEVDHFYHAATPRTGLPNRRGKSHRSHTAAAQLVCELLQLSYVSQQPCDKTQWYCKVFERLTCGFRKTNARTD